VRLIVAYICLAIHVGAAGQQFFDHSKRTPPHGMMEGRPPILAKQEGVNTETTQKMLSMIIIYDTWTIVYYGQVTVLARNVGYEYEKGYSRRQVPSPRRIRANLLQPRQGPVLLADGHTLRLDKKPLPHPSTPSQITNKMKNHK
jgi:hypothetical protein